MKFEAILMVLFLLCAIAAFVNRDWNYGLLCIVLSNQCGIRLDLARLEQRGIVK